MKTVEKIYLTLVFLLVASMLIVPWFLPGDYIEYSRMEDWPSVKFIGYSSLSFCILVLIGVLYGIWADKD